MPKYKMSQDEIGNLPEGLHATGWRKGLCVRVYSSGERNFFFRYNFAGQTILRKIGVYPYVTATELESIVDRCRCLLSRNVDPFAQDKDFLNFSIFGKPPQEKSRKSKPKAKPTPALRKSLTIYVFLKLCSYFSTT